MKKFRPVDLTEIASQTRDVLAVTVPELLTLYCADRPCKREDLRDYRLRKWRTQFHDLSAWDLRPEHVAGVVRAMETQGYAASTINRDMADLASCYAWAIRRRYCPANFQSPTRDFVRRPTGVRRVEISDDEVARLLAQAKVSLWPKLYPLVVMALHTGARKGELMRLSWGDVDMSARRAILHDTKAGVPRRLMLTQLVLEVLSAIRPTPCSDDMLVFCGRNPYRSHEFRKAWERCRDDAGLPDLHFHDLRHASAARMLKAGSTLHSVAQVLGHKDTRMLARVYGHLDDAHLQHTVERTWANAR
jgi:integrase